MNDLWGKNNTFMSVPFTNNKSPEVAKKVNTNSFDFFDNFGGSKQINTHNNNTFNNTNNNITEVKSNKNVLNFEEMFSETPVIKSIP